MSGYSGWWNGVPSYGQQNALAWPPQPEQADGGNGAAQAAGDD